MNHDIDQQLRVLGHDAAEAHRVLAVVASDIDRALAILYQFVGRFGERLSGRSAFQSIGLGAANDYDPRNVAASAIASAAIMGFIRCPRSAAEVDGLVGTLQSVGIMPEHALWYGAAGPNEARLKREMLAVLGRESAMERPKASPPPRERSDAAGTQGHHPPKSTSPAPSSTPVDERRKVVVEFDPRSMISVTGAPSSSTRVRLRVRGAATPLLEFQLSQGQFRIFRACLTRGEIDDSEAARKMVKRLRTNLEEAGLRVRRPPGGRAQDLELIDVITLSEAEFAIDKLAARKRLDDETTHQERTGTR